MKILIAMAVIVISGCAPTFQFTTDTGKKCFYSCKSSGASCKSQCFGSLACVLGCGESETYCMRACDGVEEVVAAE